MAEILPFFPILPHLKRNRGKCENNLLWICLSIDGKHGANSNLTICSSCRVEVLFLCERLWILGSGGLFFTFGTHLGQIFEILFKNESFSKLAIKSFISSKVKLWTIWFSYVKFSLVFRYISFLVLLYYRDLNVSEILRSSWNIMISRFVKKSYRKTAIVPYLQSNPTISTRPNSHEMVKAPFQRTKKTHSLHAAIVCSRNESLTKI